MLFMVIFTTKYSTYDSTLSNKLNLGVSSRKLPQQVL